MDRTARRDRAGGGGGPAVHRDSRSQPRRRAAGARGAGGLTEPRRADVRAIFLGDSLVAGVGDPDGLGWVGRLVAGAFAAGLPLTAYNLGVRRETSADVLARWRSELPPRLVAEADCRLVLSFGANDTTSEGGRTRVDPAQSAEHLSSALARARESDLPVLVVGPPPILDAAQQERIAALSADFAAITARHDVPYVDLVPALRASSVWRRELQAADAAHPGRGGYALMAAAIMPSWLDWLSAGRR